jgi:phosphoribosylformylglycinamidine synthase
MPSASIDIKVGSAPAVSGSTAQLRSVWEATAFQLERLQAAEECVEAEEALQASRTAPVWKLPYKPSWTSPEKMAATSKVGTERGLACCNGRVL